MNGPASTRERGNLPRGVSRRRYGPLLLLVERGHRTAREGVAHQVEQEERRSGRRVDIRPLHVECVHDERIPVRAMTSRRGGPQVLREASIVAKRYRPAGHVATVRAAGPGREFGHRGRDVEHGPVPESAEGRGVRVITGDREALRLLRKATPGQMRGKVLAARTEDAAHLRCRKRLSVGEIGAGHGENWSLREPREGGG